MKTAILSALALLAFASPALAAPRSPAPAPRLSVPYSDLDLNNAKDAKTMVKRIQRAADAVCREALGYAEYDIDSSVWVHACSRQATARAVSGLDAPKVTQAFAPVVGNRQLARLP
jgi:UrcA family protein